MPKWVQRTTSDYQNGWNRLLPRGDAWPRSPTTELQTVIGGLSQIWGDVVEANAALLLVTESYPKSTNLLLPDWERNFGLPDQCIPASPTDIATRETNLVSKMTFIGAQSRAFYAAQALALGQNISIKEYSPYQCGISGVGDTTNIEPDGLGSYRWGLMRPEERFSWTVTITSLTVSWNGADLFCFMNRWKPAHTQVIVDYSAVQELRGSRPWNSGYYATF